MLMENYIGQGFVGLGNGMGIIMSIAFLVIGYMLIVRRTRYKRLEQLESRFGHLLDDRPDKAQMTYEDARMIVGLMAEWECPFMFHAALSLALFLTYAVPTISKLLARTGRLGNAACAGRRAEDTTVLLKELEAFGPDSERGALALARMNWIHGLYSKAISRDDLLFTLCLFVFEPSRLIDWLEWRPMSTLEKEARFVLWHEIGQRMGIEDMPDTRQELITWFEEYRRHAVVYAESNALVAQSTIDLLLKPCPAFLRPTIRFCLLVFIPDDILAGFGWTPSKPQWLASLVPAVFYIRAFITRHLCLPRSTPYDFSMRNPSYIVTNPRTQQIKYQRSTWLFEPYYVRPSFIKSLWSLIGQPIPSADFCSEGYTIESLGPKELAAKGRDEVKEAAKDMVFQKTGRHLHLPP